MGNYMGTCMERRKVEEEKLDDWKQQLQKEEREVKMVSNSGKGSGGGGGVRVKLVLTKEELEWLLVELEGKSGKRLEDVLGEIQKSRLAGQKWKPCLESIMECPHDVNF